MKAQRKPEGNRHRSAEIETEQNRKHIDGIHSFICLILPALRSCFVPKRLSLLMSFLSMKHRSFFWFLQPVPPQFAYNDGSGFGRSSSPLSGCGPRVLIAVVILAFTLFQHFRQPKEHNPFTGREQRLNLGPKEEIAMGLHSAPQMAQEYGGLSSDAKAREYVKKVGQKIVAGTDAGRTPYKFDFHLLADRQVVNAFALPGGQIFITEALFRKLTKEDELAGVLGHEIGHVVGRHSSEQIASSNLLSGITNAVVVGVSDGNHGYDAARLAQMASNLINLKFGRGDELEADKLGVRFLMECGYEPEAMIGVMEILKKISSGSRQPEMLSTHPDPGNREEVIKAEIAKLRGQK
jgi:predicted Zn-dependent protease